MKIIKKIADFFEVKRYHDIMKLGGEYTSLQLRTMSRSDYLKEYKGWVFVATSTIASRTASLDFHLVDNIGKQIEHEYLSLIKYDLIEQIASFIKLNGSCYVWKNAVGKRVLGLHVLRPDLVSPVYDKSWSKIIGYKYRLRGKDISFKAEEILPFHNFNPQQTYPFVTQGVGDVQAAAIAIDTDNAASVWNWKFFENSARPNTAIEVPTSIDATVLERLENQWNSKFKGANNSHKPVFLTGGMKISDFGPSQHEMDFVDGRRYSRDEIFAIFKLPKAVIGLGEGAGANMNIKPFEAIFAKNAIEPLAVKIQEVLTDGLFSGIGTFEFVNVVPVDSEEVRKDFEIGGITLNEFRASRGYKPVKGGDVFKNTPLPPATDSQKPKSKSFDIVSKIIAKNTKGTEEYEQARWEKRNSRLEPRIVAMKDVLISIAEKQEKDILGKMKKDIKTDIPQLDQTKYQTVYYSLLKGLYTDLYGEEGSEAMKELGIDESFQVGDPEVKEIRETIATFALAVDSTTNTLIRDTIVQAMDEGVGATETITRLRSIFQTMRESRIEMIARTETITASMNATLRAWNQSNVVEAKEWWTAQSERTCPLCRSFHGKTIALGMNFANKGDTIEADGEKISCDYRDIPGPALHPHCLCTLIPITK